MRIVGSVVMIGAFAATLQAGSPVPGGQAVWNDASRLVFFAVLEGLYRDGVKNEIVNAVIGPRTDPDYKKFARHFVYACPLCHPTYEAFKLYQKRERIYSLKAPADTLGPGLDESIAAGLASRSREERMKALQGLVSRWVAARLDLMRLDPDELSRIGDEMEKNREMGMKCLERERAIAGAAFDPSWTRCAICDGSAGACRFAAERPSR